MNSLVKIDALNKSNYETWKIHMEAVLTKADLWQYVNGELVKPETTQAAPNSDAEWEKKDGKAKAELILCISDSELSQLQGTSGRSCRVFMHPKDQQEKVHY